VESEVHEKLSKHRVPRSEFFWLDPLEAKRCVDHVACYDYLSDFPIFNSANSQDINESVQFVIDAVWDRIQDNAIDQFINTLFISSYRHTIPELIGRYANSIDLACYAVMAFGQDLLHAAFVHNITVDDFDQLSEMADRRAESACYRVWGSQR
jgi:hypothetical protein